MYKCCKCGTDYDFVQVELGNITRCQNKKCRGEIVMTDDDDISLEDFDMGFD